jgi:hypothetical protein
MYAVDFISRGAKCWNQSPCLAPLMCARTTLYPHTLTSRSAGDVHIYTKVLAADLFSVPAAIMEAAQYRFATVGMGRFGLIITFHQSVITGTVPCSQLNML